MKLLAIVASLIAVLPARGDTGDDTLKYFLSKSDLVVMGKIVSDPIGINHELGVPNFICDFRVQDVLKGDGKLKDQVIKVNITRFEMEPKDKLPVIKKDGECILFLKREEPNVPTWGTADFWFGVQHPSPWLARSLKRLAAENDLHTGTVTAEDQIERLSNILIVPPNGTDKADVDLVFGKPKEIKELDGKGSPADYPMHIYELLPPVGKEEFSAFLYVTYRQGKVWRAGINHLFVTKNRYSGVIQDTIPEQESGHENPQGPVQLRDIRKRFRQKPQRKSWNKDILAAGEWSEPVAGIQDKKTGRGAHRSVIRGRLLLCKSPKNQQPAAYLEVQDCGDTWGGITEIYGDMGGCHLELRDAKGQPLPPMGFAFGGGMPGAHWMTLPCDSTVRLRISPYASFSFASKEDYFMSGSFVVDPPADHTGLDVWQGTLKLPAMKIVVPKEIPDATRVEPAATSAIQPLSEEAQAVLDGQAHADGMKANATVPASAKTSPQALIDVIKRRPDAVKDVYLTTTGSAVNLKDGSSLHSDSIELQRDIAQAAKDAGIASYWD